MKKLVSELTKGDIIIVNTATEDITTGKVVSIDIFDKKEFYRYRICIEKNNLLKEEIFGVNNDLIEVVN